MKKLLFAMFAFALGLGMTSCKNEAAANKDGEKAEQAAEAADNADAPSLADIVAKAKAEGANWSIDEWKEQFKAALVAVKPMLLDLKDLQERMEKDPTKADELMKEAQDMETKFADLTKLMDEFDEVAKATENGKKVSDDDEFGKQVLEELGLGDIEF